MRQHVVRIAIGLLMMLLLVGHAAKGYKLPLINQLDAIVYDTRLKLTMPRTIDERIVILDIDEKSLAEVGRWPWGRDSLADLVAKLFDKYGLVALGFDVVFAEPDVSSGLPVLEELGRGPLRDVPIFQGALEQLRPKLDHDALFAKALVNRPVVLGYYFTGSVGANESGSLPEPVLPPGTFKGKSIEFKRYVGFGANLPILAKSAPLAGHFLPDVDSDGVSRRVPMIVEHGSGYYESLSMAMIRMVTGMPKVNPGYPPESVFSRGYQGMEWLDLPTERGTLRIPVDEVVTALIPYRGLQGSFRYISLTDVLHDRVPIEAIRGKIGLVGTTAPGLQDLRSTPVGEAYAGVEIHANLISGMLDMKLKQKPRYVLGAEVVTLVFFGLLLAILLPMLSPQRATLVTVLALLACVGINLAAWQYANLVLPLAASLVLVFLLFAFNMSYGYFVETRSKRQFTELFGQYVPPELVDEMAKNPESYSMEGKNEELTVLFSDVRGFTTISESLEPKALSQLMNEYLSAMTRVIRNANQGTLDKYMGDAIMAFWGAPVAQPDHARRAVRAALEMQAKLAEMRDTMREKFGHEVKIGVGLCTGEMTVGDMGSEVRKAYTVMGDSVNLGSRLEGITKQYGVGILVSETTRRAVPDVVFREIDRVRVKGKEEPVAIFEPMGFESQVPKAEVEELKLWNQTLKAYRSQQWEQAELQLFNLQRMAPGRFLYKLYMDRIQVYRANPPGPDWDGVTTFETK